MNDNMDYDKHYNKKRKNKRGNHKQDYSKNKSNKFIKKDNVRSMDEVEMLRIQGLTICKSCNVPCPLTALVCPTCGEVYQGD